MKFETQIKIQAFLDGELPEAEAREITALIAREADAAALHAELKHTRQALTGAEEPRLLPETREFYWSKIQREIERGELAPVAAPAPSAWTMLRAWFRPVGVMTVVALIALLALVQSGLPGHSGAVVASLTDDDAITFQDQASGTTFVWFSYPAENEVAEPAAETTLE